MKFSIFFVSLFLAFSGQVFAASLQSVNGVYCGRGPNAESTVVPVWTKAYLYEVNSYSVKNDKVILDLKIQFFDCLILNGQYVWTRNQKPYGLFSYTEKGFLENNQWKKTGYWKRTDIQRVEQSLVYNVRYSPKISKLLNKSEYASYEAQKTVEVSLKLDVSSDGVGGFYSLGYQVLTLRFYKQNL